MANRERVVQEFLELVRIDSPTFKEREMADALMEKLKDLGLEVYEDSAGETYGGEAGNVIGRLKGNSEAPVLLFLAHMDRVEPGKGIKPVVEDGMIRSQGETILAADNCAGIAAVLEGLRLLREGGDDHGDIEVAFTMAEEGGLFGAKALDLGRLKARIAYTFDSTGDIRTLVVKAPAQDSISIVVRGKASHAGVAPEEGVNAIQAAAKAVAGMQMGRIDQETTSNIGIIQGGKATNIVPDRVELKGEVRSMVEERVDEETEKMASIFTREAAALGAKVEFKHQREYSSFRIGEEEEVARRAVKALQQMGRQPSMVGLGGGSDANILNAGGIRTLNIGNGSKKVHTTEEEISVQDLVDTAEFCYRLMKA